MYSLYKGLFILYSFYQVLFMIDRLWSLYLIFMTLGKRLGRVVLVAFVRWRRVVRYCRATHVPWQRFKCVKKCLSSDICVLVVTTFCWWVVHPFLYLVLFIPQSYADILFSLETQIQLYRLALLIINKGLKPFTHFQCVRRLKVGPPNCVETYAFDACDKREVLVQCNYV